jgi:hypothetical protein
MTTRTLFTGFVLSCLAAAQVPVEKEPRHHFAFETESLRVLEPQIPAGDTTLEHLHAHDDATVCIHGSSMRARQPGSEWSNPGGLCVPGSVGFTEYTGKPRSHTVQNVGSGVYHLTLVENLRPDGWTNYDALAVTGLKMIRENRAFRAYDLELSGSGVPAHAHQVPTIVIVVSGEVMAGDKRLDQPGQSALIPAGKDHQIVGHGEARVIEIEVR